MSKPIFILFTLALLLGIISGDTIVSVVSTFRHGARSPIDKSSWDLGVWPQGYGELTPEGYRQHYLNGKEMAYRYIEQAQLISPKFSVSEIYIRSTDLNRTVMSVQSQLYGMFSNGPQLAQTAFNQKAVPPLLNVQNQQQAITALGEHALPNGYQPVPVHVVSASYDNMLVGSSIAACPRMAEILQAQQQTDIYKQKVAAYTQGLQKQISQVFGITVSYEVAGYMADTLTTDKFHKFDWPPGVTDEMYYQMYGNQNYTNSYFYTPEASSLAGSQFFQAILDQFDGTISGTSTRKFGFYSAHDTTLIAFLNFLGVFDGNNPIYASTLIFELHNNNNAYAVHISYNGASILLDGCVDPCPYATFKEMMQEKIIANVTEACQLQNDEAELSYNYNPYLDINALS
ncbi:unnamed protein product [Blepharisma stoltei]|uniref:Acid phosphatase n=1 Tax=Blepharisma stoltei TaxID=1481888 RepID=A0AAU9JZ86_9CILI|nr:unnamed protein product [Blepharisma stoltei]